MLISDWSSDVCSSDLPPPRAVGVAHALRSAAADATRSLNPEAPPVMDGASCFGAPPTPDRGRYSGESALEEDRKGVVEGQRVSERGDLGGRRRIKYKKEV